MGTDRSFWTIPGIIIGLAALATAIGGFFGVLVRPETAAPSGQGAEPATGVSPPPTAAPQEFRVVDVFLAADPSQYTGGCPVTIRFPGRISVAGDRGNVSYRFLRSDGAKGTVKTLHFDKPGSQDVEDTWARGEGSGRMRLEVLDPQPGRLTTAAFTITCQ